MNNEIYVGSDHAGYAYKIKLLNTLKKQFPELVWSDVGCHSESSCDYPEFAEKVAENVIKSGARGILVCGSGIGVAIAANKIPGIRAATIWSEESAVLSKEHNDTNVVALGARLISLEVGLSAVTAWLKTQFVGGRHQRRIDLITSLEKKYAAS